MMKLVKKDKKSLPNVHKYKTHIWKQYSFRLAEPGRRKDIDDDRIKKPIFRIQHQCLRRS